MRKIYSILFIAVFISCLHKNQEIKTATIKKKNVIPNIVKDKSDTNFTFKNGLLFFKDKLFSGIVNEYYTSSKIKSSSQYYQGKREGFYNGWYQNGTKWFERNYTNGFKTKTHLGWFDNGSLMFRYQFNNQGDYNGEIVEWYANKQKFKEFHFVDGVEDGSQKMWQPNGKIKANYVTKNGERFGVIGLKKCYTVNTKNEAIQ